MSSVGFRDRWATCKQCERRYVFRVADQRALAEQGKPVEPSGLCPDCREVVGSRSASGWPRGGHAREGTGHRPSGPASRLAVGGRDGRERDVAVHRKVYVGRLSYDTQEEALHRLFNSVGTVQSATVIRDRYTGWSRGFGFVEMATSEGAQRAIRALNGANLDGRQIKVAKARPRQARS